MSTMPEYRELIDRHRRMMRRTVGLMPESARPAESLFTAIEASQEIEARNGGEAIYRRLWELGIEVQSLDEIKSVWEVLSAHPRIAAASSLAGKIREFGMVLGVEYSPDEVRNLVDAISTVEKAALG